MSQCNHDLAKRVVPGVFYCSDCGSGLDVDFETISSDALEVALAAAEADKAASAESVAQTGVRQDVRQAGAEVASESGGGVSVTDKSKSKKPKRPGRPRTRPIPQTVPIGVLSEHVSDRREEPHPVQVLPPMPEDSGAQVGDRPSPQASSGIQAGTNVNPWEEMHCPNYNAIGGGCDGFMRTYDAHVAGMFMMKCDVCPAQVVCMPNGPN